MRFRPVLAILAAGAIGMTTLPAHAADDFGAPIVDQRFNNGEVGYIHLTWGGADLGARTRTTSNRPMDADCRFVVEAGLTSAITVDVVAVGEAGIVPDGANTITPAGTKVECKITLGNGVNQTIVAAGAGPAGTARGRFTFTNYQSPITLCSRPSVLWSDGLYQERATWECVTS